MLLFFVLIKCNGSGHFSIMCVVCIGGQDEQKKEKPL